jgi:phage shock protein PspC (stress-responsive transcriptional regulator)
MRLIFVLSLILPGPQILIYLVLWVIIPEDG